ncbi:classical arabinogalactan protein 9-like [Hyaena hyaena]|uniref:classical arabinogalactan protein 9-like n=1 Tax=Hyaena hyaena TaxID=95912 RepID=UPI001924196B|nr:classical arabinogalactan protein 9-like [Hyaena hyaena]
MTWTSRVPDLPPPPLGNLKQVTQTYLYAASSQPLQGYKPEGQFPSLHPQPLPQQTRCSPDVPPACPPPCPPHRHPGPSPASLPGGPHQLPAGLPAATPVHCHAALHNRMSLESAKQPPVCSKSFSQLAPQQVLF